MLFFANDTPFYDTDVLLMIATHFSAALINLFRQRCPCYARNMSFDYDNSDAPKDNFLCVGGL